MNPVLRFLAFVLMLASGCAAAADVGRVVLAAGETSALRQGQALRLAFGALVQDKDVLRTGAASNLQVRFEDDSYVSLRESSELRVDQFNFAGGAGAGESAVFSLLKGGLRAVTGLIGRVNHDNYKMVTPTATIGIRGTDYAATFCQGDCKNPDGSPAKDGLYGRVIGQSQGTNQIHVSNDADQKTLGINSNFFVGDRKAGVELLLVAPDFVLSKLEGRSRGGSKGSTGGTGSERASSGGASDESRPSSTPDPLPQLQFVATNSLSPQGTPAVLQPANGFGVAFPGPSSFSGIAIFDNDFLIGTYNGQNQLTSFGDPNGGFNGSLAGGSITDTGSLTLANGQVITWGRWTGATSVPVFNGSSYVNTANVPLLFVTATDVKNDQGVVGKLGGVATYTFAGGPRPVDFAGNVGTINSTSMTINFTTLQQQLALNMSFPSVIVSSTNYGSAAFNLTGIGSAPFCSASLCTISNGDLIGGLSGSCSGGGCASASASGYFTTGLAGPVGYEGAAVAGLVDGTKAGEVAFLNLYLANSFTPGAPPVQLTGQLAYAYPYPAYSAGGVFSLPTGSTVYSGNNPIAFNAGSSFGSLGSGSIVETGSIGLADGGTMNWGRWTGPTSITDPVIGTYSPATGVPFVVGNANVVLPTSGTFLYLYAGGPNPTSASGAIGSFTGGAFNVTFGSTSGSMSVASPLTLAVGGLSYSLNSCSGGCTFTNTSTVAGNMMLNGTCSGGACSTSAPATANAAGIFVGPQGAGLAVAGNITTSPSTPTVSFAAGFKR
jgi:hypothetical protein